MPGEISQILDVTIVIKITKDVQITGATLTNGDTVQVVIMHIANNFFIYLSDSVYEDVMKS